ncbi:hypothetical protein GCM10010497_23900 [Streptomyces cinereoruber]|uniref:Uncharacterized protein n=1 Tax=Streptomyces cinereoruber TaxID=67260 RepID=A0AAV4KF99_9ACTN|nr:hypothetical protein [Streptomyces cinereoruber]MBB4162427.1 hypothetical protein [Streptomyces cinereoruber]MBY8820520.1 hypothetical protein [Streptomyces cinereoruber]NIH63960.1 hypothetical protein [Streptomyces cinereoruber]GGR20788.1 hypothetical protein GCM10010497_23900 [Streptomyces cinereoruber]
MNHPVLALGSTDWLPVLELGGEAAVGCDTHAAVRVQAQVQLIKVRLFTEPLDEGLGPDPSFTTVFEGPISLADGRLVVGDVMGAMCRLHNSEAVAVTGRQERDVLAGLWPTATAGH